VTQDERARLLRDRAFNNPQNVHKFNLLGAPTVTFTSTPCTPSLPSPPLLGAPLQLASGNYLDITVYTTRGHASPSRSAHSRGGRRVPMSRRSRDVQRNVMPSGDGDAGSTPPRAYPTLARGGRGR
jgi:hypothetical protein